MPERNQRTNRLLSLLSDNDYERLRPHLSPIVFDYRKASMRHRVQLNIFISPSTGSLHS